MMTDPTMKPTAVPPTARNAVAPVPKALDRSTDKVPSTTQNPCCDVGDLDHRRPRGPSPRRRAAHCGTRWSETTGATRAGGRRPGDGLVGHAQAPIDHRASAPAASSAASATISVAMPRARA